MFGIIVTAICLVLVVAAIVADVRYSHLHKPPSQQAIAVEQQAGDAEWEAYIASTKTGRTFMFGEMQSAYEAIRAKYPLWRIKDQDEKK